MSILAARISSPFLVSSRKAQKQKQIKASQISDICLPFNLEQVNREYFIKSRLAYDQIGRKEQTNAGEELGAIPIGPDMIGLYNYLAAHNIRQKVKHPLFLALKFDHCFFIYYDPI